MAKAKGTFHIFDTTQGRHVEVLEGETIPEHLLDKVGEHLGGTAGSQRTTVDPGSPAPDEGSEEYRAALEEAYQRGVTETREVESAAYDVEGYGEFDPSAEGVNAQAVHDYLSGLNRDTVGGRREFDRVTAAEVAGKNRSTALVDEGTQD